MAASSMVMIDTCIWASFFNRPNSRERKVIDGLLDDDRVAIVGPILGEVLQGFRRDEQADWVASSFRGLREFEVAWDDWRHAAQLGRELSSRGHKLPLTDLVIAAVSISNGISVFTVDPHFDLFPNLKRFQF
ncbi:MAG: PIN domain-containing protein [Planctomycetales bacterium]|nr:PIN domain-containing protein [Planctomycetales bacterium]